MEKFLHVLPILAGGAKFTLGVTLVAVCIGIAIGLVMSLCKLSNIKVLKLIANIYIEVIRGTPLFVQIFLFHYGIASLVGQIIGDKFSFPVVVTAITVCGLNSGAYVAEIFRAGIQSVDKGQTEAARSLGMSHAQSMRLVILPQAFKAVIPPLGNEFVVLLKDTSLLSAIGAAEIMKRGQIYNATHFEPFSTYLAVACIYLILTFSLTRVINWYEKRLNTINVRNPQG